MSTSALEKGMRVVVTGGQTAPLGLTGTVFWLGENQWERMRAGVRGDDGETWWLDPSHLEPSGAPAPTPSMNLCAPEKGDVVRWKTRDGAMTGVVFWQGPDKFGDGTRLGVRGNDGETHWLNAAWVEVVESLDDVGRTRAAS